jgi:hypothetical protein
VGLMQSNAQDRVGRDISGLVGLLLLVVVVLGSRPLVSECGLVWEQRSHVLEWKYWSCTGTLSLFPGEMWPFGMASNMSRS